MSRNSHIENILGPSLYEIVLTSRVLVVGAGGIGCELLKNLVLSGFRLIELVDLDTIDLSNLNRQFLFQKQHIKKSKAHVAKESALKFNPNVEIISHHANIKDPQFNVDWFKRFNIVMNALDNLEARRYVNSMCLAANVPLVESGTEGYLGQVTVIKKDMTECYDCQPKPMRKTYAVCTIRSTPISPIHCIVWAKSYLFSQLFGISEEEEDSPIQESNSENAEEIENLREETEALKQIRLAMGTSEYPRKVFQKVFTEDIQRLLMMEDMWKTRQRPVPLKYEDLEQIPCEGEDEIETNDSNTLKNQRTWSLRENFDVFIRSLKSLSARLLEEQKIKPDALLSFDKDDSDALNFVTATSNLRARIFGIEEKSIFQVKAMAGNIIPAIATTNAVIAGIIVIQSFNILKGRLDECKTIYLDGVRRPNLLPSESLKTPNLNCAVCRNSHFILKINTKVATLRDFVEKILCNHNIGGLDYGDVTVEEGASLLYDVEYDDNLDVTFEQLKITDGKLIRVTSEEDQSNHEPAIFAISHRESFNSPNDWYEIEGEVLGISSPNTKDQDFKPAPTLKRKLEAYAELEETSSALKRVQLDSEIIVPDDEIIMTEYGLDEQSDDKSGFS
ncbi:hypothetical protein G9A89_020805 [Geosiphon pyriformis]|nr:hypothetical protein G9A89_020805 [Geosiphon pyriformis]